MLITSLALKNLLPKLEYSDKELAGRLSQIGLESKTLSDGLLEVDVTPNRGDCLSLYGIARELSVFAPEVGQLREPEKAQLPKPETFLPLTIQDPDNTLVIRDELLQIDNYRPTKSPIWLSKLGKQLGWQPRDLLIDLTNYVMWELGCPLHVFSKNAISSGLDVRLTDGGESITLLDNTTHQLPKNTLVQYSNNEIVDLVGIMGGKSSAFDGASQSAIIQAGVFSPSIIRQTAKSLGLRTEASFRYERYVDATSCQDALARFAYLAKSFCPSLVITGYQTYGSLQSEKKLKLENDKIAKLLGIDEKQVSINLLERAGFKVNDGKLIVPSWRNDIDTTADIAEEVAKAIGYEKLEGQILAKQENTKKEIYRQLVALKLSLCELGCTETYSYVFAGAEGRVALKNPRTSEQATLRSSLLPNLLNALARNPFLKRAAFFEIGHVFEPEEKNHLGVILANYSLEEEIISLLKKLGIQAEFSDVDSQRLAMSDVRQKKVRYLEVDLSDISESSAIVMLPKTRALKPISKFPCVSRDVTLALSDKIDASEIEQFFEDFEAILLCEEIDRFTSREILGQGKIAYTFKVLIQALDKSLTDEEATKTMAEILDRLRNKVVFELR